MAKDTPVQQTTAAGTWTTRGFEAFRRGQFGNGGQNLYVSRQGVLQRIHQYDLNRDGHVDLLFCNSQNHCEIPPSYCYRMDEGQLSSDVIPTNGASCMAVADLNGDGRDELIIGRWYDGVGWQINGIIHYDHGSGWDESAVQYLPAPMCIAIAAGDFDGDGRVDLVFQLYDKLRLFLQCDRGMEPKSYRDLPIQADHLTAADLDSDGCADLVARFKDGRVRIYWGGPGGLDAERYTEVPVPIDKDQVLAEVELRENGQPNVEWTDEARPRAQIVTLDGKPHLFVARREAAWLVPVEAGRRFGEPCKFPCHHPMAIAAADLDGNGKQDIIVACRDATGEGEGEQSWIFWGGRDASTPTPLPTSRVSDVAVLDFDGDGSLEIAFAYGFSDDSFDRECPVYRLVDRQPQLACSLPAHDARQVIPLADQRSLMMMNRQGRSKLGNVDISVFLGGDDGFQPDRRIDLPGWGATVAICADFNDNGYPDIALANTSENSPDRDPGSYVYLNGPEGFSRTPSITLPTWHPHGIACADISRNGFLDLLFAGYCNDELTIFHGRDGGFDLDNPTRLKLQLDGRTFDQIRFFHLADLNGDGYLDLVLPLINQDYSLILFGGPDGFSMDRHQKLSAWHVCSVASADLDGDGYLDLILGGHSASPTGPHDSFLYIYWNGPDGLREDRRTLLPVEAVNAISVADFNNDGHLDLFAGCYQDGRKRRDIDSYLYWNRGGRGFSAGDFTRLFNHSASGNFAADFNNDGWIDLAVANHKRYGDHLAESKVWWNGPDGFSECRVTNLPSAGPHGMVAAEAGNNMDRGPEEFYTSEPHQLPQDAAVSAITWKAELGPRTWIKAQLRTAPTPDALTHAPWHGPDGANTWFNGNAAVPSAVLPNQWIQYRLALGATNSGSTPRVTEVTIHYEFQNAARRG